MFEFGLLIGLGGGPVSGRIAETTTPNQGIQRSAWSACALALVFGLLFGLLIGVGLDPVYGQFYGVGIGLYGGLGIGLAYGG